MPMIPSKDEGNGLKGKESAWEKSFGPDEYERVLRGGMQFADVPRGEEREVSDSEVNVISEDLYENPDDDTHAGSRGLETDSSSNRADSGEW